MPVSIKTIRETSLQVFLKKCEVCGEDAYFGEGVSLNRALGLLKDGNAEAARELLGKWYCSTKCKG